MVKEPLHFQGHECSSARVLSNKATPLVANHDTHAASIGQGWERGTLLSGSAGTGMAWDWNWLDDDHFYRYIQAAAQIVKGIPFSRRTWRSVQVQAFEFADALRKLYYADTLIEVRSTPSTYRPALAQSA